MPTSETLRDKILNHFFKNTSQSSPTTVYASLHRVADPKDGGEITGAGGYARQAVAFSAITDGVISNTGVITFTASADWGDIYSMGIYDAVSGGNLLYRLPLVSIRNIPSGQSLTFAIGQIAIMLQI